MTTTATTAASLTTNTGPSSSAERSLRHEVLIALVAQVGVTCNFTTLDGAGVLYLDRVEAP